MKKIFFLWLSIVYSLPGFSQTADSLSKLGQLYEKTGDYQKAEPLFIQVVQLRKTSLGVDNPAYATGLDNLGRLYMDMGQNDKAEPLLLQAKEIRKKVLGENTPDYATSLNSLAWLHVLRGQYPEAVPIFIQSKEIRKATLGVDNADYATAVDNLASLYDVLGQNDKAEPLFIEAKQIRQKVLGENHIDYAYSLNNLAAFYDRLGQYDKAEPLYIQAQEIWRVTLGEDKPDYATGLNNLSTLYMHMGQYEKAVRILITAVAIRQRSLGDSSAEYAQSLGNLAALYYRMGRFEKVEPLYTREKGILLKVYGENNSDYAGCLNGLAALYEAIGQYEKAKTLFLKVNEIQGKLYGKNHPYYGVSLNNLGVLYCRTQQYEEAERLFTEEKELIKNAQGENNADYPLVLTNLVNVYRFMGQYEKAESLCLQAIQIDKKILGENHPAYARALDNLAIVYGSMKLYDKAEPLLLQAKEIQKRTLGEQHPDYSKSLGDLALVYTCRGQFQKAESLLLANSQIVLKNLKNVFTTLSEKEKDDYLQNIVALVETNNSFLYRFKQASPAFVKNNFDLQLFFKSLSLSETQNMLATIEDSPDSNIQQLFSRWKNNKQLLGRQYSLPLSNRIKDLDSIEGETEGLEVELTRQSAEFRRQQNSINITTSDVQNNLSAGEAAIEFVRFKLLDKTSTDSVMYAAYILGKKDSVPQFIPLCEERQLESILAGAGNTATTMATTLYRGGKVESSNGAYLGDSLYQLIGQPLEPYLHGVKKIAYAPAGKLFGVAFAALPVNKMTLLMDKYDLQQYSSTRQIALRKTENQKTRPANIALFGDPRFTMDSGALVRQRNIRADSSVWVDLPGTAKEVTAIGALFQKKGLKTYIYTQTNASETNLKALSGHAPQVLHIATHGFFLPESEATTAKTAFDEGNSSTLANDPLLRSGLIFAGGNDAWSGKVPMEGTDDGIATAYEISQLNLRNTELVVLSACETALGDVKGSEGVFGLQRAFKMAGTKKLIVSLWQVPDKETAELMTTFYSYWMNGTTIEESFARAQGDMKRKYSPYYWAAFELID